MKPVTTIKIVSNGTYYCSRCGALYFRQTECNCPNLLIKEKEVKNLEDEDSKI